MAALGIGLVAFIVLGVVGVLDSTAGRVLLVLVQYIDLFAAGFLAARFSGTNEALNGGVAGLSVFSLAALISMIGGADLGVVLIAFLAVVAVIIGTAGGVLAAAWRR